MNKVQFYIAYYTLIAVICTAIYAAIFNEFSYIIFFTVIVVGVLLEILTPGKK